MPAKKNNQVAQRALRRAVLEQLDSRQLMSGSIHGYLISDNNANYSWDDGDTRNAGWRVYLDANNNSAFDSGETSLITDSNGYFKFNNLAAGNYTVRQVLPAGWRQTFPRNSDNFTFNLVDGALEGMTFGATQAVSEIAGTAFNDANGNGVRDSGETVESNRTIYFDDNNNGQDDLGERWTTTDSNGNFSFSGLPAGTYRIRMIGRYGWTQTFGGDSALAVVNGRSSVSGLQFAHQQDAEPASYDVNKIMSFMLIGGSDTVEEDRQVGWNLKADGWAGFVSRYIQPQITWGVRRIMIHNPFGTISGEDFRADQAITAREQGLNWLVDGFVAAWAPVIAQGIEVVAYMGTPCNDPSFDNLDDTAWWARAHDAYDLPMQAGMSIGFDMSLGINPGDRDWDLITEMRNAGHTIYGEPRPPESALHWRSSNLFAEDYIWQGTDPEANSATYWAARDSQITGDVVRLINRAPAGLSWNNHSVWLPGYARSIMRQGHSVAISVTDLIEQGVTLNSILSTGAARGQTASVPQPADDNAMPLSNSDNGLFSTVGVDQSDEIVEDVLAV